MAKIQTTDSDSNPYSVAPGSTESEPIPFSASTIQANWHLMVLISILPPIAICLIFISRMPYRPPVDMSPLFSWNEIHVANILCVLMGCAWIFCIIRLLQKLTRPDATSGDLRPATKLNNDAE